MAQVESQHNVAAQREAQQRIVQQQPTKPALKRKIALGRVTNETAYGRSLLRDRFDDPLGKQVTDMLSKALTESGQFLVFERPDLGRVVEESRISGGKLNLVGVDVLVVGSLTEFGRKTIGETGFFSQTKRQVAFAKVDLRLVDTTTAQVVQSMSGAGESSTESASVAGFGSQAAYDATLNDTAIRTAVASAVSKLISEVTKSPWSTAILKVDQNQVFISGGKSQGLKPGMQLSVETRGEKIKSPQTGFDVKLPGRRIATIQLQTSFGDSETNEGSVATVTDGSLQGFAPDKLTVVYRE
ncbi:MAG TPA: CsgG/HfaB family protein [Burkholderiales bacterium]|nr:CsgG/HfaB family protein [Burkholderiales bacterium]